MKSKIALSVLLAAGVVFPATADAQPDTYDANPLVWLFNDLKKIVEHVAEPHEAEPNNTEKTDPTPQKPERPVATKQTTPVEQPREQVDVQLTVPASPASVASDDRNPIEWFFSDLAGLFSGGSDPAAVKTDNDLEAGDVVAKADLAPQSEPVANERAGRAANEPVAPVVSDDTAPSDRNPIEWLFSDLASLFSPNLEIAAPVGQVEVPVVAQTPTSAPAKTATPLAPSDVAEVANVAAQGHRHLSAEVARMDVFEPSTTVTGKIDLAAPPVWDERPHGNTKNLAAIRASAAAEQPLRRREESDPTVRNYASLGRPVEDKETVSLLDMFDHFMGNDYESDDDTPSTADAPGEEVVANTIPDNMVPAEKLNLSATYDHTPTQKREAIYTGEPVLRDVDLYLGQDRRLGALYNASVYSKSDCISRDAYGSVFCLDELQWPADMRTAFDASTAFALPGEVVARYDDGRLNRLYSIFDAAKFADVVKLMQKRFGPPTEREIVWMHMLEAPELPNTSFRWHSVGADRRTKHILEVRNYDNLRRSFADLDHGLVRLYKDNSRPIFKHLTTMDLMLLQRRRLATAKPVLKGAE